MIQNFINLLKEYKLKYLRADFAAGISVAAISLPQVMAYALIAGLNPVYGIYTFVVSTIAATFTGTSNYLIVGPTNIIAVTIASTLNSLNMINSSNYLQGVLILTFLAGILQIILTSLQLGKLVNFISDSVIQGLTVAVAFIIASSQIAKLFGLSIKSGSNVVDSIRFIFLNINQINFYALIIGIITLIIILTVKIRFPNLPAYMIAIIGSAFIVYVLNWQDQLELVGRFESSIPKFNLLNFNFELISNLWSSALSIAIIGFIQVLSIVKAMEKRTGELAKINKEFLSQGIINIVTSFFSGFAVTGSFTKSFANFEAGAKTRFSELIAGLTVFLAVLLLGPIVSLIPIPSLAVIVIFVAFKMINITEIKKNLSSTKLDMIVFLATFITAMLTPRLDYAIYIGVVISIIFILKNTSEVDYSYIYYNDNEFTLKEYSDVENDNYIIINLAGLIQFNAADDLRKIFNKAFQKNQTFLIRIRDVSKLDLTMVEELKKFVERVQKSDGEVMLSGVSDEIYRVLKNYDLVEEIGKENIFRKKTDIFSSTKKAIKKVKIKKE